MATDKVIIPVELQLPDSAITALRAKLVSSLTGIAAGIGQQSQAAMADIKLPKSSAAKVEAIFSKATQEAVGLAEGIQASVLDLLKTISLVIRPKKLLKKLGTVPEDQRAQAAASLELFSQAKPKSVEELRNLVASLPDSLKGFKNSLTLGLKRLSKAGILNEQTVEGITEGVNTLFRDAAASLKGGLSGVAKAVHKTAQVAADSLDVSQPAANAQASVERAKAQIDALGRKAFPFDTARDKLSTPAGLPIDDSALIAFLEKGREKLVQRFKANADELLARGETHVTPEVTDKRLFTKGDKQFKVSTKATATAPLGEDGKEVEINFATTVVEHVQTVAQATRKKLQESLRQDVAAIKVLPLEAQVAPANALVEKYGKELGDKVLAFREHLTKRYLAAETLRISSLPASERLTEIGQLTARFGQEFAAQVQAVRTKLTRQAFQAQLVQTLEQPIEKQPQILANLSARYGLAVRDIATKFKAGLAKKLFAADLERISQLPIEQQSNAIEQLGKQFQGQFVGNLRSKLQAVQKAHFAQALSNVKDLPVAQQASGFAELQQKFGIAFGNRIRREERKVAEQQFTKDLADVKLGTLSEQEQGLVALEAKFGTLFAKKLRKEREALVDRQDKNLLDSLSDPTKSSSDRLSGVDQALAANPTQQLRRKLTSLRQKTLQEFSADTVAAINTLPADQQISGLEALIQKTDGRLRDSLTARRNSLVTKQFDVEFAAISKSASDSGVVDEGKAKSLFDSYVKSNRQLFDGPREQKLKGLLAQNEAAKVISGVQSEGLSSQLKLFNAAATELHTAHSDVFSSVLEARGVLQREVAKAARSNVSDKSLSFEERATNLELALQHSTNNLGKKGKELKRRLFKDIVTDLGGSLAGVDRKALFTKATNSTANLVDATRELVQETTQANDQAAHNFKKQSVREQRKQLVARSTQVAAGVGIGLFGQAGFPLLNIAFSALSGGPIGAALVGVATGAGEVVRAFLRLEQVAKQAANEIGLVGVSAKSAEAKNTALFAVLSLGSQSARTVRLEERLKLLEKGDALSAFNDLGASKENLLGGLEKGVAHFLKEASKLNSFEFADPTIITKLLAKSAIEVGKGIGEQGQATRNRFVSDLEEARRAVTLNLNKPQAFIETDPLETFRRMQATALDPTKAEEVQIARDQLAALNRMLDILRAQAENEARAALNQLIPARVGAADPFRKPVTTGLEVLGFE